MSEPNTGVRTLHPEYSRLKPLWENCRNVVAGQHTMHAAGTRYIEKLRDEEAEAYRARLSRSNFFNGTWRTIAGLKGMAFRQDPAQNLPSGMESLAKDITLSGVSLNAFASNIVEEVLEVGRVGVLVDYPKQPENVAPLTVHAAETLGMRPSLQFYPAEAIRNWRFARVGNAWVLTMVTLAEAAQIHEDEFSHKTEEHYRVLDLDETGAYRQRVFRSGGGKDELVDGPFYPVMNGAPLRHIPFITIGATGKGDVTDEPPLIDLVDANIALYQVNSDRRHGLHFTGLPTAVVSGYSPSTPDEKLYIGSTSAWLFSQPEAKASFLEFTGQGLAPSKEMSIELKQEMALLGARMLADESRVGSETLGGTQIKHQGENSMLAEIVGHVSDALEWCLDVFAQWAGQSGKIEYQINRRFLPMPMGAQELTALVGAWQSGALSEAELFAKLQEGEVIAGEKTLAEHQGEVEVSGGPVRPVAAANDGLAA